ncbi:MAG: tRNA-dependent cyclodipeptide synthase [Akkermansiaceae bacterium]|nr:tRNA-dependent cyclodipeptide synthase [Akkermansiaceae bacterium]
MSYTIKRVISNVPKDKVFGDHAVCMGISLDNPHFRPEPLAGILEFVAERFANCLVFIGDYLYRYDLELIGKTDGDPLTSAVERGAAFLREAAPIFHRFEHRVNFDLVRLSSLVNQPEFSDAVLEIRNLYRINPSFRKSLHSTAESFVARKERRGMTLAVSRCEAVMLSVRYLIEEIAFYKILGDMGHRVELYPGSELPILRQIIRGEIRGAPESLVSRSFIELKQKENTPCIY